jgi:hypothetical protein
VCTLIAFHRVWPDLPLVVATNRDEAYDRPSEPPRWNADAPRALTPLDGRAGGTWMGANERGLWVGLTNRRGGEDDPSRRSRGLLCRDLLRAADTAGTLAMLDSSETPYNPFHVLLADGERMFLAEHDGGGIRVRELPEGCHLITNRPYEETGDEPKAGRVWRLLNQGGLWPAARDEAAPDDLEDRLIGLLADHGQRGPDAICLHGGSYGTKSSGVWTMTRPEKGRARISLRFADGPPCSTPFQPFG